MKDFSTLPKIIAVDFDGTIVSDEFPKIGKPNYGLIRTLRAMQRKGVKLILWTSRNNSCEMGALLTNAIEACEHFGLKFDAINENISEVKKLTGGDTRKVYADVYLDDHSINAATDRLYWSYRVGITFQNLLAIEDEIKDEEILACQENKPL